MRKLIGDLVRRHWSDSMPVAWVRDTLRMRKRVHAFDPRVQPRSDAPHVAVVLTPWCGSAVPWFSMVYGLLLAANGNRVSFVVDGMPFGSTGRSWRLQLACIRFVLRRLRGRYPIIELQADVASARPAPASRPSIERLAHLNVVWAERGELGVQAAERNRLRDQLTATDAAIATVLASHTFDVVLVPGGVWGSSGLWCEHARSRGMRLATYDSGSYGTLLLAVDGIACQLQDIPRAFSLLKARAASHREHDFIVEAARAEIGKRRAGVDRFASQVQHTQAVDPRFKGAVLMALNSPWDSAALGLHTVFGSTHQWIVETARFLLERTNAPVLIRQHPVERLEIARSSDDYRGLLAQHFGAHPRLHFIAAQDPVNSYELLEHAAAVVVYTSTVGVEAASHGKPVVTESSSYYADLGFVRKAETPAEYRQALLDAVEGRFIVTPAMQEDALTCYYLTQCCNWVTTPFNVPGFAEWSCTELDQLARDGSVRTVVRAVEQDVPVAYLNHLARLEAAPSAT